MKILTVDDSSVVRKVIRAAVEALEFEVLEAEDGFEALEIIDSLQMGDISLVLLDWNMPRMSGLEVLKRIKMHKVHKKVPVMMVTTESHKDNIVEAIRNGAAHYTVKPFTIEELMTRILECLGKGDEE